MLRVTLEMVLCSEHRLCDMLHLRCDDSSGLRPFVDISSPCCIGDTVAIRTPSRLLPMAGGLSQGPGYH
jgi:hypothetical protein